MITKVIYSSPDGKFSVDRRPHWKRYFRGIKIKGSRPHLAQVFGEDFDQQDLTDICSGILLTLHPGHTTLTINGEFFTPELVKRKFNV